MSNADSIDIQIRTKEAKTPSEEELAQITVQQTNTSSRDFSIVFALDGSALNIAYLFAQSVAEV